LNSTRLAAYRLPNIQHTLTHVLALQWVIQQCLTRIERSFTANELLLRYGLRATLPATSMRLMLKLKSSNDLYFSDDDDDDDDGGLDWSDMDSDIDQQHTTTSTSTKSLSQSYNATPSREELESYSAELAVARLLLLNYLDRLHSYNAIVGSSERFEYVDNGMQSKHLEATTSLSQYTPHYRPDEYRAFRESNAAQQASQQALRQQIKGLEVLFNYHSDCIVPYRLQLLSLIPEIVPPKSYERLLPQVCAGAPDRRIEQARSSLQWRDTDWIESATLPSSLDFEALSRSAGLSPSTPHLPVIRDVGMLQQLLHHLVPSAECAVDQSQGTSIWMPSSAPTDVYSCFEAPIDASSLQARHFPLHERDVAQWYTERALQIEQATGVVEYAYDLIRLAVDRNVVSLRDTVLPQWQLFGALVYQCEQDLSWHEFEQLDDYRRFVLLIDAAGKDQLVERLTERVWPIMSQLWLDDARRCFEQHLQRYLIEQASNAHLGIVARVMQQSKPVADNAGVL
jgi:hypothetical protein